MYESDAFVSTGAWPHGTIRAHGSSLSLVLIKPSAHVRGVAPQASRAHGSSLSLVLIKSSAHVRAGGLALSVMPLA